MLSGSRSLTANLLPTAAYNDKGIDIVSIGVQTFTSQDSDRDFSERTVLVSTQHISCHFQLEIYSKALAQVRGWSREFGFALVFTRTVSTILVASRAYSTISSVSVRWK